MTAVFAAYDQALKQIFNSAEIISKTPAGGGCINQCSVLSLSNGQKVFLKENTSKFTGMFAAEAEGLKLLKERTAEMHVPQVLACSENAQQQWLLLEWIEEGRGGKNFWANFGRALAEFHVNQNKPYGLSFNNYIGSTVQKNSPADNWCDFFGERRLGFQLKTAVLNGLNSDAVKSVEKLIASLPDVIPEKPESSLLHGDLWSGNFLIDKDGNAVLIDPAVYYGDSECDLAMTKLFGGFTPDFYNAYQEIRPFSSGWRERFEIYNLYHLLNHFNLFGVSYQGQIVSALRQAGF